MGTGLLVDRSARVTRRPAASSNPQTYSASSRFVSSVAATQARFCSDIRSTPPEEIEAGPDSAKSPLQVVTSTEHFWHEVLLYASLDSSGTSSWVRLFSGLPRRDCPTASLIYNQGAPRSARSEIFWFSEEKFCEDGTNGIRLVFARAARQRVHALEAARALDLHLPVIAGARTDD